MSKGKKGDAYQVVYVDGDVPQLPIQLGQLLVDSSGIAPGNTNLQQCTSQDPLTYEDIRPFFRRTAAEEAAGVTPTNYFIADHITCGFVNMRRYGWVSSNSVDQTDILFDAYAVAKEAEAPLQIPSGITLFSETFVVDHACGVIGESREDSILLAAFTGLRVKIDIDGEQGVFSNLTLDVQSGTGNGIEVWNGSRFRVSSLSVYRNTIGILLRAGNLGTYRDIRVLYNTSDGFKIDSESGYSGLSCWDCSFYNIDCLVNGGWGFNLEAGQSHVGDITAQENDGGGVRINTLNNDLRIYAEANDTWDIFLADGVLGNVITNRNADSAAKVRYVPNNLLIDGAIFRGYLTSSLYGIPQSDNAAGNALLIRAGFAGAGATGHDGGDLDLQSGEAVGTAGAAAGGDVKIRAAAGVNGGAQGTILIDASNVTDARAEAGGGYSASITPNARVAQCQDIRATNNSNFAINAPLFPREGDSLEFCVVNLAGVPLGTATWNAVFKMTPWVQPAIGTNKSIFFRYDGTNWQQKWVGVDVPN